MGDQMDKTPEQRRKNGGCMLLLCLSGLLINTGFAHLARMMALPLYLDNIGSALAAALGGYIPGIIVGFLTNLINGIWDYSSIYYGSLTILIAMASAWFAGKKYYSFRKPWRLLAIVAVFALIGGGLGSMLTWFLYGFSFASGISAPLALRLFSAGITNEFLAQFAADLLVDLADKSVTVLIVALSFSILPASLRQRLYYAGWLQTPLSREKRTAAGKKRARIVSLRLKLIALVISGMDMVESRDKGTGDHVRKTAAYADIILRELKRENVYADQLTDAFVSDVIHSAPLHDIGKIHVSDLILNKPGKLSEDEFETMKTHTTAGADMIRHALDMVSESDSGYLREAMNLANYHHEKWDGTGYPRGLKGEEIPLSARIMAVADVFDALVSRRSYKDPFPFEKAMQIIREESGTRFDPAVAGAFFRAGEEVRRIMNSIMDS